MQHCVIFDLDNCLADDRHRIPLIDRSLEGEARWHAYHEACHRDPADTRTCSVVLSWAKHGAKLVFVTGRPESVRGKTVRWLMQQGCRDEDAFMLLMRPPEPRGSVAMKRAWLHWLRRTGHTVVAAYDDRQDIVDMYALEGVPNAEVLRIHDDMSPHDDILSPQHAAPVVNSFTPRMEDAISPGKPEDWADVDALAELRPEKASRPAMNAADILQAAAETFRERNARYNDNYKRVAPVVAALFPDGVPPRLITDDRWHLFELAIVKLTRLAVSLLDHNDSARDAAVYLAMIEAINYSNNAGNSSK